MDRHERRGHPLQQVHPDRVWLPVPGDAHHDSHGLLLRARVRPRPRPGGGERDQHEPGDVRTEDRAHRRALRGGAVDGQLRVRVPERRLHPDGQGAHAVRRVHRRMRVQG